jgi:hypothetical protein
LNAWREIPASLDRYRPEMKQAAEEYDFSTHLSLHASHAATISNDFAKALAVAGTVDECRQRVAELAATGVDRITFALLSGGRESRLASLVQVADAVRETNPAGKAVNA